MADITVIIVNYNTADLALKAAASVLERSHGGHKVDLHLVDNNSPNGDAVRIHEAIAAWGWQEALRFHPEPENHGFGRGNNVVLKMLAARPSPPDYVFLLNPDATLDNETLALLADFLDANPKAGAAGAQICKPGDPVPVTAAFRFPGLASTFAAAVNFGPVSRLFDAFHVALPIPSELCAVDWIAGAAVMGRFQAWQDVDFFDPDYFLYYEEVDLMLRTTRAGWENWYVPEAMALHMEGESTGVKSGETLRRRRPAYLYASWRMYFAKNHGRAYALWGAILWLVGGIMGTALARLRGKTPSMPLNYAGDIFGKIILRLLGRHPSAP